MIIAIILIFSDVFEQILLIFLSVT